VGARLSISRFHGPLVLAFSKKSSQALSASTSRDEKSGMCSTLMSQAPILTDLLSSLIWYWLRLMVRFI